MTIPELTSHVASRQGMTDIEPRENTVYFSVGTRRYIVDTSLRVLEVRDGKVFASTHADYQQGILRGGRRDEDGRLQDE